MRRSYTAPAEVYRPSPEYSPVLAIPRPMYSQPPGQRIALIVRSVAAIPALPERDFMLRSRCCIFLTHARELCVYMICPCADLRERAILRLSQFRVATIEGDLIMASKKKPAAEAAADIAFNKAKAEEILKSMAAAPEKFRKRTKEDDLRDIAPAIFAAVDKGVSYEAISEQLRSAGAMSVSPAALRAFVKKSRPAPGSTAKK